MDIEKAIGYLRGYNGPEVKLMEVCGTHTAAIFKSGIRSLISPGIKLISGPGCPVCVTPAAYIDKCMEYASKERHIFLTFGDMMKVPGSDGSLSSLGKDGNVELMYSPFEALDKAEKNKDITFVIGAVGFETTAPAYGLLLKEAMRRGIENIRLLTALKTIVPALSWICENQKTISGFICPGHVSVITGMGIYEELARKYEKPFVVAGFEPEHIAAVVYDLVRQTESGKHKVKNLYPGAVREEGNKEALKVIDDVFTAGTAVWRGLGAIEGSGLYLRDEYGGFDGGSRGLDKDIELPPECSCAHVIVGEKDPDQCPMFGTRCTPIDPYGPCMVSAEGACGIWYRNR